jgi:3-phytase
MKKTIFISQNLWFFLGFFVLFGFSSSEPAKENPQTRIPVIKAVTKTDDVSTKDDSADDPVIFINRKKPKNSVVLGTNKNIGISVYDLNGETIKELYDGELNNVDMRYDFYFNHKKVALVAAGNRTTDTIDFYMIEDGTSDLKNIPNAQFPAGLSIYGSCLYADRENEKFYIFVNSKDGDVVQWEIVNELATLQLNYVRDFNVGSQTEGCVVDDKYHRLYISEETVAIWQYDARGQNNHRQALDRVYAYGGNLAPDIEGIALYKTRSGRGYIIASSQGDDTFAVYERKSGKYRGKFQVSFDDKLVEHTDGLEVASHNLGLKFPFGMLVVQDGSEQNEYQSFKYVPWNRIASRFVPALEMEFEEPLE